MNDCITKGMQFTINVSKDEKMIFNKRSSIMPKRTTTTAIEMSLTQFKGIVSQGINELYPDIDYNRMQIFITPCFEKNDSSGKALIELIKDHSE